MAEVRQRKYPVATPPPAARVPFVPDGPKPSEVLASLGSNTEAVVLFKAFATFSEVDAGQNTLIPTGD